MENEDDDIMGPKVDECDIFLRGQARHGQKNSHCVDSLLLTLVRLSVE